MSGISKLTEEYLDKYCQEKRYAIRKSSKEGYTRIEVSNMIETIPITLYATGSLVIGGKPKGKLRPEFESIKQRLTDHPELLGGVEPPKTKPCAIKYTILIEETRGSIKVGLETLGGAIIYYHGPTPSEEYRAKISIQDKSVSITQYKNGTLFLQGKDDDLFSAVCDLVEKTATPPDIEVITRFIASDEQSLLNFTASYSPQLLESAEEKCREILTDELLDFLDAYDKKWLIAAQCLLIANIPLPEYSPIVMPASKAFEGFVKKLLTRVGFYTAEHFNSRTANFAYLKDRSHAARSRLEGIERYAGTYLDKIAVSLDTNRNFVMHSDNATITKIDTYEEAANRLSEIHADMKEVYNYFKNGGPFGL